MSTSTRLRSPVWLEIVRDGAPLKYQRVLDVISVEPCVKSPMVPKPPGKENAGAVQSPAAVEFEIHQNQLPESPSCPAYPAASVPPTGWFVLRGKTANCFTTAVWVVL